MGADGSMMNEDRQHTVPWGKLNYNYNWQNGTNPKREHFFTFFVPKLKSFNDSITANYSSGNFGGGYLNTEPPSFNNTYGDNLGIWTSPLTWGGTWYFVKGANSTTGAMYDWVANDIVSDDCIYNFVSHTFTNCGATGRTGPTITQMRTEYAPSGNSVGGTGFSFGYPDQYDYLSLWYEGDWDYLTMTTQGLQVWTVPATGVYEIEMIGAKGGTNTGGGANVPGGRGGYVKGTRTFNLGDKLTLIVGQAGEGTTTESYTGCGGGGASWVLSEDLSVVYAVAGGGGGTNGAAYGTQGGGWGDGTANTTDSAGGGQGSYSSGGGAGYGGNGTGGYSGTANPMGGLSPANGALGGSALTQHSTSSSYQRDGGFGGGGANGWHAGGGGGGYAGGDAVGYTTQPGALGGTTYGAALTNPTYGSASSSATHGFIKITRIWLNTLYSFTTHTFTNAGATGRTGPTLTQLQNTYSSASWASDTNNLDVTSTGIQLWTVPKTGSYRIEAWGAAGGETHSSRGQKGNGARMRGDFSLTKGEIIRILVGQQPPNGNVGSGGGGGSFVVKSPYNTNASILVIAGGGGCWYWDAGSGGTTSTTGQNSLTSGGSPDYAMSGGSSGNGGDGSSNGPTGNQGGAGGGGFFTAGGNLRYWGAVAGTGGHSFTSGGLGGAYSSSQNVNYYGDGGFGGGGASAYGPGGGGGYSGGGGDWSNGQGWDLNSGGGGGSYNNGSNQSNSGNVQYGHGQVTITAI